MTNRLPRKFRRPCFGRKYNIKIVIVPKCADFVIAAMHETGPKCIVLWFTGWRVHHKYCMDSPGHQLPNQAQTWLTLRGQFPHQREAIKSEDFPKAIDCERWSRAKGTEFCWNTFRGECTSQPSSEPSCSLHQAPDVTRNSPPEQTVDVDPSMTKGMEAFLPHVRFVLGSCSQKK